MSRASNQFANQLVSLIFANKTRSTRQFNNFQTEPSEEEIIDEDRIIDLSYEKEEKRLCFKIQHYHSEPKISRYVQRNYERFPVYDGDYSERTRIVKNFNKVINPIKFLNEDILNLRLEKKFILEIISTIGIIPAWREKEIKIENLENQIKALKKSIRDYASEERKYKFKSTTYPMEPGNFWVCLLLVPFTLGFSFRKYVSKNKASQNIIINKENHEWNQKHKTEIDKFNSDLKKEIEENNRQASKNIFSLYQIVHKVRSQEISYEKSYEDGWFSLKDSSFAHYPKLQNKKAVFIIWNKTKNKYYVGQSKNVKERLLNLFKDGEPKNITFAKDWFDGDNFVYKYYYCESKDDLDLLQKRYIEEYSAFENGYNKTRRNI